MAGMFAGLLIYGFYGYKHSKVGLRERREAEEEQFVTRTSPTPSYGSLPTDGNGLMTPS